MTNAKSNHSRNTIGRGAGPCRPGKNKTDHDQYIGKGNLKEITSQSSFVVWEGIENVEALTSLYESHISNRNGQRCWDCPVPFRPGKYQWQGFEPIPSSVAKSNRNAGKRKASIKSESLIRTQLLSSMNCQYVWTPSIGQSIGQINLRNRHVIIKTTTEELRTDFWQKATTVRF